MIFMEIVSLRTVSYKERNLYMLKQLKPNNLYFVIKISESYAEKIFQVLKEEQMKLEQWPEGDISFEQWVKDTFGQDGLNYLEAAKSK